jgi:hypothetical protein
MGLKALLVGINDYATAPLKGCINDVVALRDMLQQRYVIDPSQIRILTDGEATRAAIEDGLRRLAAPDEGDTPQQRLFHFSGHGTCTADENGDEPDGRSERIVPHDYTTSGSISNKALREIYGSFAPNVRLLLLMDCCHSGTTQRRVDEDIRYRFLPHNYAEEQRIRAASRHVRDRRDAFVLDALSDLRGRSVPLDEWEERVKAAMRSFDKKRFGQEEIDGNVVLISACRADQMAAEACFGETYHGALTYYLLDTVKRTEGKVTYDVLIGEVGRNLYGNNFTQEPQLEGRNDSREQMFLSNAERRRRRISLHMNDTRNVIYDHRHCSRLYGSD